MSGKLRREARVPDPVVAGPCLLCHKPNRVGASAVPAYTALDARWGWRINRNVEVSLTLQNLLDPEHGEFDQPGVRSEYRRSAFFNLVLRN